LAYVFVVNTRVKTRIDIEHKIFIKFSRQEQNRNNPATQNYRVSQEEIASCHRKAVFLMFKWGKKKIGSKGKSVLVGICLILSILTMTIATFAWFTTIQPGTDKVVLTSDDNSVVVDAYAYKPGYTTDTNGDPVEVAHDNHSATPLLAATKLKGAGSATYTVTFSSDVLSTFSYSSLYGDELYQNEKNYPHVYIELRYTKPTLNGFVKAMVKNLAYAGAKTGYTNITSSLKYEYRTVTEQNTSSGTKYINGFTAAYADTSYTASAWTTVTDTTADFSLYNSTTDIAGYNYGSSYTVESQCYVPSFPYKYDATNYYYSKATFLEFRVNPLSWFDFFKNNTTVTSSSTNQYSLGVYNFGVSFDVGLEFSNNPYYDSSSATAPRVSLSTSLINMQPSTSSSTTTVNTYNFSGTPTFAVSSSNDEVAIGSVSNGVLTVSGLATGTTTLTVTATSGTQTAQALCTVRVSGPTLTLSASSLSIKMGSSGTLTADAYNFSGTVTLSVTSSATAYATAAISGSTVTITPVAIGSSTITVTATDGTTTKTATCEATITAGDKTLSSIAVTTQPTTTVYNQGDTLDTSGIVVTATWNDNTTSNVTASCSYSPTELTSAGTQTITVSYAGKTTTFTVTVNALGSTYTLITSTTDLVVGDQYIIVTKGVAGAAVAMSTTQNTNNRSQADVTVASDLTVEAPANVEQLTLAGSSGAWEFVTSSSNGYLGTTSSTTANVLSTLTASTAYSKWSVAIASTGVATITNTGKSSRNVLQYNSTSSLFACYTSGQSSVYLYHKSATNSVSSIAVTTMPTTTSYTTGQTLNLTGMVVTATMGDGSTKTVTGYTTSPASGATLSTAGTQTVTVTYENKTTSFTVSVTNPTLSSIAVTTQPTKTTYTVGETLDLTGMVVTGTYSDSSTAVVTGYTTSPASGDTLSTVGTQTVTVTYNSKTTTFTVTVNSAQSTTTGTAVYTVSTKTSVTTTGTTPTGSSISFVNNGVNNNNQMTSGKSMTFTLSNLSNVTVTSLVFSMKSNTGSGAGGISYTSANNATATYLVAAGTEFSSFPGMSDYSSTFANVSFTSLSIAPGSTLTIVIAATANSLYCQSLTMGWSQTA
jgi:hypothetical protein